MTRGATTRWGWLELEAIRQEEVGLVGGKAARLAELRRHGFQVPDGFVLTTEVFDDAGAARQALAEALPRLGAGARLAVRSSAIAEDLDEASFAGQYETILDVSGADEALAAIKACWQSAHSARVEEYSRQQDAGRMGTAPMAVLVQRMVPATAAGVAFTANPVSGDPDEVLVSAVRGLGHRLVTGTATPDEWSIRQGRPIPHATPEAAISAEQALLVEELARRVEAHYGAPQDIEWALAGDRLFLLQARPITALPLEPAAEVLEVPPGIWIRDAIHAPEPISPAYRFFFASYQATSREFREAGFPIDRVEPREIGGWLYFRNVPIGGKERKPPPAWLARLLTPLLFRAVPSLRASAGAAERFFAADQPGALMETWYREWRPAAAARIDELRAADLESLGDDELDKHLATVLDFNHECWLQHARLHFADLLLPAELIFFCQKELGWKEGETLEILRGLSSKTTEPAHRLAELTELARQNPDLARLLKSGEATVAGVAAVDAGFATAFDAYQRSYGCRALRQDPVERTVAECPELVLSLISDQLESRYDATAEAEAHGERREAALERARKALADRPKAVLSDFARLVERAQRAYPIREDNEFYLISAPVAFLRYALREIGRRLAASGQIGRADDVFFLEIDELRTALRGGGDSRALVQRRKGEQAWVKSHPGPSHYGEMPAGPPLLDGLPAASKRLLRLMYWGLVSIAATEESGRRQSPNARVLAGVGGSAGSFRGPVRVIKREAEFGKIRGGDVLVCRTTSPVWSVIFPSVGAVVTDTGGILAHAALIAREYRVPAVLATGNATEVLKDGQMVTVDGSVGEVRIEA